MRYAAFALLVGGCGSTEPAASEDDDGGTSTSTSGPPTTSASDTSTPPVTSTGPPDVETTGDASTSGTTSSGGSSSDSSSGSTGPACARNVVLMGYWPPTNEMLRPWSTNDEQNPDGWIGEDWNGLGYDVYAFFPEFPPDGDPSNDPLGSEGSVGSPESDLRVDYQDTSDDFWRIVDEYAPQIIITTSRGGDIGWEIEALEGGHYGGTDDPADDWSSDGNPPQMHPIEDSVEPRTWEAISTYRMGSTLDSSLPLDEIQAAADDLALVSVSINYGTSGTYLSGFLGLHGVYYADEYDHVVAGGHIHVGYAVSVADASALIEATLQAVLEVFPPESVDCP